MEPFNSTVFAAGTVLVACSVLIAVYWNFMEFGQRVYCCLASLLVTIPFFFLPFTNPDTQQIHWGFAWAPPVYTNEELQSLVTPKLLSEMERNQIPVSPDFVRNTTTRPMLPNRSLRRGIFLGAILVGGIGWIFVPSLIDRIAYKTIRNLRSE